MAITFSNGLILQQQIINYSLYDFTTFTFTNAGATGRNGPTYTQLLGHIQDRQVGQQHQPFLPHLLLVFKYGLSHKQQHID